MLRAEASGYVMTDVNHGSGPPNTALSGGSLRRNRMEGEPGPRLNRISAIWSQISVSRDIMARAVGFEPTTNRLTADCSTAELRPNNHHAAHSREGAYLVASVGVVNRINAAAGKSLRGHLVGHARRRPNWSPRQTAARHRRHGVYVSSTTALSSPLDVV